MKDSLRKFIQTCQICIAVCSLITSCLYLYTRRYVGGNRMTAEDLDRIKRAEEIQRYTENRCEALEKENEELRLKWLQATDEGTSWANLKSRENEIEELRQQIE